MKFVKHFLFVSLFLFALKSNAQSLDSLVNQWHKSAGEANFETYFNLMDTSFVFLGTAPGERWKKEEFATFSKPYFDKGQAWNFIPSNRIWNFSPDKKMAWFDEDLSTWMEGCRGSGILIQTNGEWKIVYYNLTVLIENEKIKEFIELRKK